jgi:hypothetical protein
MRKKIKHKGRTFFSYGDYFRNGRTTLHRYKYEKKFGAILPSFHLHHIDGNKFNNRFDNLELLSSQQHCTIHKEMRREALFKNQLTLDI